jgi:hypothetical protein
MFLRAKLQASNTQVLVEMIQSKTNFATVPLISCCDLRVIAGSLFWRFCFSTMINGWAFLKQFW